MLTLIRCLNVPPEMTRRGALRRILFIADGEVFAGLENGADPDKIPVGEYQLIMATMKRKKRQALWVQGTELFVHAASYPDNLEGCSSPGSATRYGVNKSRKTMARIHELHGGFLEGRRVPFRCTEITESDYQNMACAVLGWVGARNAQADV